MLDFLCKESYDLRDFVALVSYLRSPNGCPWDQVQTHESIRRNFLEETYEGLGGDRRRRPCAYARGAG